MRWRTLVGCGSARRSCAPRSHFLNSAVPVPYIYPPARFASWLHRNSRWPQHVGMLERAPADRHCLCVNRDDETLRGYCLSASRQLHKDATPRPRNSSFASPDCYVGNRTYFPTLVWCTGGPLTLVIALFTFPNFLLALPRRSCTCREHLRSSREASRSQQWRESAPAC